MKISTLGLSAILLAGLAGPVLAEGTSATPGNTASPSKEADKMRSGNAAGSLPNSSNPGTNAGADGNQTQDSRTTKTRDR